MELVVGSPGHDEGKLHRMLEGPSQSFPGNATIGQFFQSGFIEKRIDPSAIAIIDDEITYTFEELDTTSAKLAEVIRDILDSFRNGNSDGDVVIGVCMPPSSKLVLALMAIVKLGAAYLPFEASFPEERVFKIVKDSKPIMIIADHHTNVLDKFEIVKDHTKVVPTNKLFQMVEEKELSADEIQRVYALPGGVSLPERTAIVLYTSGSSGEPKGVRLSHRCIMNRLNWQWQTFPFGENEKCAFKTSLTFVDSVAEIFGPLLMGQSLTVFSKKITSNPSIFMQKLEHFGITRIVLVPSLLRAIFQTMHIIGIEEGKKMLDTVKLWICSGEALTKDLVMEFFEHFHAGFKICNFYGSTEIMADVCFVSYATQQDVYYQTYEKHIPIGLPIYNTIVYVLNKDNEMCQNDEIGEIYIGGHNLAKGYVGVQDHPSFITNPFSKTPGFNRLYKTGDYGRVSETQGKIRMLAFEGRFDSQIKVRGQRVDLSEIENVVSGVYLISKSKVLCFHPGEADQTIVAFIVPANEAHIDRIKTLIDMRLREYERPVLRLMESIPLLVNGKTDRQRLLQIYGQDLENRSTFLDWTTLEIADSKLEVAEAVVTVMSEVTGTSIETIAENIDNSFYNVGGSSLNSIMVIVKLRDRGFQISIPEFTSAKSVKHVIYNTEPIDEDAEEVEDWSVTKDAEVIYYSASLMDQDKEEACNIIAHSFSRHGDLEVYTKAAYSEFYALIQSIWNELVEKGFSFIIRRRIDNKAIGVSLSFDVYDEPSHLEASQGIAYVLEMLEFLESRQREKLPKGKGKLIHSFMMGTSEDIDESDNVLIVQYMEEILLKMAMDKNFFGIMTTNTNPLTQQIGMSLHGYEVLSEYQVNRYVAPDGSKPFILAPDSFKIVCCWKRIGNHHLNAEEVFFSNK